MALANETGEWRIYADLAHSLLARARKLYLDDDFGLDLRVKYYDKEQAKTDVFLTNNFEISAIEVALLYKYRWQIELFFKWIKQHLKIKRFWGESENAVKTQIWIAICNYLLVAIVKKELKIEKSLYEILQIISVSMVDKSQLTQLLSETELDSFPEPVSKQLNLFDL